MIFRYEFGTDDVGVTWTPKDGNYDPSHYTVQFFENNTKTETITISAESNSLAAQFTASFSTTVDVRAKITVTSKCNQTTNGVFTETLTITSTS